MFGQDLGEPRPLARRVLRAGASVDERTLTSREVEVLQLVATGNSNKLIARALAITQETVKSHVKRVMEKTGARDRTHAVTLCLCRGILQL
jgi:two-component system, NarL family, response regulator